MKQIEIYVQTNYELDKKVLTQTIKFNGAEKYMYNPSLVIHRKIEDKIINSNISDGKKIFFKDMIRKEDYVIIEYNVNESFDDSELIPVYQKIIADLPETFGCDECQYICNKNKVNYCIFQNMKPLINKVNKCRFFSQKKSNKS